MQEKQVTEKDIQRIQSKFDRQLNMMEMEYELCKKYDDPQFQADNQNLNLQGYFDQDQVNGIKLENKKKLEEQNQEDQINQILKDNNEIKESDEEFMKFQTSQNVETNNQTVQYQQVEQSNEEDEAFQDFQEYEQLEEEQDDLEESKKPKLDFSGPKSQNPLEKKLDVEKIKQIMSQIQLKPPAWAENPLEWNKRVEKIINDDQQRFKKCLNENEPL